MSSTVSPAPLTAMHPAKRARPESWNGTHAEPSFSRDAVQIPPKVINFLLERDRYYPIFNRICCYLPVDDLCSLMRCCKGLSTLMKDLRKTHWNINNKLRRFVKNPVGLRSQLAIHNGLIAGGFAVQFLDRVTWDSDLDIFAPKGEKATAIGTYLVECEGYTLVKKKHFGEDGLPRDEMDDFYGPAEVTEDLGKICDYTRRDANTGTEVGIQVLSTSDAPVVGILRCFYTTAVVNIITWNKAYSVYPTSTFVRHKTFLLKMLDRRFGGLLAKYRRRGWDVRDVLWEEDKLDTRFRLEMSKTRRVGDSSTWILPLDTTGVTPSAVPDSVIEYSQFNLWPDNEDEEMVTKFYRVDCKVFYTHVLKYKYCCSINDIFGNFWTSFAGERCDKLLELELFLTAKEDQPDWFRDRDDYAYFNHWMWDWDNKPLTWTYYDNEIPRFFKMFVECRKAMIKRAEAEGETTDELILPR